MAQFDRSFNAEDLPQQDSYDPILAGDYEVVIKTAELKSTKNGNGQYIKMRMDVEGGDFDGRVLFCNLNIKNASAQAEEIGRKQLRGLMNALGLATLSDTDQLLGGRLMVSVKIKDDPEYGKQNEVKAFKAMAGSAAPAPAFKPPVPAPAVPAAPRPAGAAPPWAAKK